MVESRYCGVRRLLFCIPPAFGFSFSYRTPPALAMDRFEQQARGKYSQKNGGAIFKTSSKSDEIREAASDSARSRRALPIALYDWPLFLSETA